MRRIYGHESRTKLSLSSMRRKSEDREGSRPARKSSLCRAKFLELNDLEGLLPNKTENVRRLKLLKLRSNDNLYSQLPGEKKRDRIRWTTTDDLE